MPENADYRGITHRKAHPYQRRRRAAGVESVDRAIIDPQRGKRSSWDHTPGRRGITHRTIVGSHTESRGITHREDSQGITKTRFFGRFSTLNLLNDSYLTESLNPKTRLKRKEKELRNCPLGNGPSLRAGYRRHKSGLTAAGFREKPSRSGGVYLSA